MSYFESRLKINFDDFSEIQKKIEMCERLGIKNVILEVRNYRKKIPIDIKKKIQELTDINLFYRINLKTDKEEEFIELIKKYNQDEYLISIESLNKDIQIIASKDSRVDLISFSEVQTIKTITSGVISLIKQNNKMIEFSLAPIMEKTKTLQSRNFRNLYRSLHLARRMKVKYIISGNFENVYDLRNPRALLSICYSLLDVPLNELKKVFRENPKLLLEIKNQKKKRDFFETGVRLIQE